MVLGITLTSAPMIYAVARAWRLVREARRCP
jgi:hypothetical protein